MKRYPNQVFFFKEDKYWMEYKWKNGMLLCRYEGFFDILKIKTRRSHLKAKSFIKERMEENFNIEIFYIGFQYPSIIQIIEKYFNGHI